MQTLRSEGNVMILADNSGSMNQAVYHLDYDPNVTWSAVSAGSSTAMLPGVLKS